MKLSRLAVLPFLLAGGVRAQPAASVAGSIVRSKEWVVRRGKNREEEFIGDVHYDASGANLSADWALYRQGPNDWRARGNIYARKEFSAGDVVETRGQTARYDQNTLKGRLDPGRGGRVPVLRTPPQGAPDHAEGDSLSWVGEQVGILSGRARGWGPRGEFWADEARYERLPAAQQSLTLSGNRPVLHSFAGGKDAALKADKIVAFDSPRRAVVTGRAMGWILTQSSAAPTNADARCGQGDRSEGPGADAQVSALLAPLGAGRSLEEESRFWKAEVEAFAAHACPWGPRFHFWADAADYSELPDRRLTLTGGRPVLRKIDDHSIAMKADRIVAFGASRRVEAAGQVKGWVVFNKDEKKHADKSKKTSQEKTK